MCMRQFSSREAVCSAIRVHSRTRKNSIPLALKWNIDKDNSFNTSVHLLYLTQASRWSKITSYISSTMVLMNSGSTSVRLGWAMCAKVVSRQIPSELLISDSQLSNFSWWLESENTKTYTLHFQTCWLFFLIRVTGIIGQSAHVYGCSGHLWHVTLTHNSPHL